MMIQYSPADGAEATENPPRFTWLPEIDDEAQFVLRIKGSDGVRKFDNIPVNFFTPPETLSPGDYTWAYAVWADGAQASEWSAERGFTVGVDLPETPLARRDDRLNDANPARPRLWLGPKELKAFRNKVLKDENHCNWSKFHRNSVETWVGKPSMKEPAGYPDDTRVATIWRQTYIDCQELIYAIRHLAVAGHVLEDDAYLKTAKDWLLEAASWDPDGKTSRAYTDEWAYRVCLALAWGYDWLHGELSETERAQVRRSLLARTRQVADHAIKNAAIHVFPYDSHAVRSISAVLVPACIAMLGEEPEAEEWLHYSIEFLFTVYSPWGGNDGGWAEGPHYWMTGMAYLIDAANLLRSYTGIDIYKRPFFQKTGDFPLYTKAPDTKRATFGDDSTMGDPVSLKVGYNLRQFAGVTGNAAYQWYFDEIVRKDKGTEKAFYNYGWWDLNFDDMVYRHDFEQVEGSPPKERLRHFKGVGWAAIQTHMNDPDRHIQFVMKASRFGSISHSHGDQNAFCLSAFGEDLAIQSGHYVAFHSSMHMDWRRQTRSKNAVMINGRGQYAGSDKPKALAASGSILAAEEREDHIFISGDATAAYQSLNPEVTLAQRDFYFVRDEYFVIVDTVDASKPVTLNWLLHANGPFELGSNTFRYSGQRAGFYGKVLWSEAGEGSLSQVTGFPDIDPADYEGLDISTHLDIAFPATVRHRVAVLLVPYRLDAPKRVFNFLDDQGYDVNLYLTDADERSFKVVVPKSFAAVNGR
ncbi:MAG: DUF4962 domain-containing protein [Silicimonas sp.]|nr:DUF4962 domain-containing protein [Silicimonas sp.]